MVNLGKAVSHARHEPLLYELELEMRVEHWSAYL
jgi:hypothetical protein